MNNLQTYRESNANAVKNPANKRIIAISNAGKRDAANPWRLEIFKEKHTAILTVRTFSGDEKVMFEKFAAFFKEIKRVGITNLIIDLDDNAGGDEAAAAELFSYLILNPTRFIRDEYLITDKDTYLKQADLPADMLSNKTKYIEAEQSGRFFVQQETQKELSICSPKPDHFSGKFIYTPMVEPLQLLLHLPLSFKIITLALWSDRKLPERTLEAEAPSV